MTPSRHSSPDASGSQRRRNIRGFAHETLRRLGFDDDYTTSGHYGYVQEGAAVDVVLINELAQEIGEPRVSSRDIARVELYSAETGDIPKRLGEAIMVEVVSPHGDLVFSAETTPSSLELLERHRQRRRGRRRTNPIQRLKQRLETAGL